MALESIMLKGKKAYFFTNRFFKYQGKQYEIVSSVSTGRNAHDVVHLIKSESGQYKEVKMQNLLKKLLGEGAV